MAKVALAIFIVLPTWINEIIFERQSLGLPGPPQCIERGLDGNPSGLLTTEGMIKSIL